MGLWYDRLFEMNPIVLVSKIVGLVINFKVRLIPNMIFVICNIWVILRRNVIYLHSKNPDLDQLSFQLPDMMSLGELQISF